jgi:hypothetical protein
MPFRLPRERSIVKLPSGCGLLVAGHREGEVCGQGGPQRQPLLSGSATSGAMPFWNQGRRDPRTGGHEVRPPVSRTPAAAVAVAVAARGGRQQQGPRTPPPRCTPSGAGTLISFALWAALVVAAVSRPGRQPRRQPCQLQGHRLRPRRPPVRRRLWLRGGAFAAIKTARAANVTTARPKRGMRQDRLSATVLPRSHRFMITLM